MKINSFIVDVKNKLYFQNPSEQLSNVTKDSFLRSNKKVESIYLSYAEGYFQQFRQA